MVKKTGKKKEGYSPKEMHVLMHRYIDESAERLRKQLREAWKKQRSISRSRHGTTV